MMISDFVEPELKDPQTFTSENYRYEDDPRNYDREGNLVHKHLSCDALRRRITLFLASKQMTQAAFLQSLGVNANSFRKFMSYRGPRGGENNGTYEQGLVFFAERDALDKIKAAEQRQAVKEAQRAQREAEKAEKKAQTQGKKRTASELNADKDSDTHTAAPAALATVTIVVPAAPEETTVKKRKPTAKAQIADEVIAEAQSVQLADDGRVFDDCDEIRTKIAVLLQSGVPQNRFAAAIGVAPGTVNKFLAKKGAQQGAGSLVYAGAYNFFERLRIARKEPKSEKRKRHEREHPQGFELKDPPKRQWIVVPKDMAAWYLSHFR